MPAAPKEIAGLLMSLSAKLDQIREADITLETQVVLKECSQLCAQALTLLKVTGSDPAWEPEPAPDLTNAKTLLVVDDDEDTLRLLNYLLTRRGGFRVECKNNAREALEKLDAIQPDVILVDLMMPHMSGFEFLRKVRAQGKWKHVKIMVGSSRSYDKDRLSALGAGANDFIPKPYNLDELVLRLRNLVSQSSDLVATR